MNFKELEKMVKADGWRLDYIDGSHHNYRHPAKSGKVTIPRHGGDFNSRATCKTAVLQVTGGVGCARPEQTLACNMLATNKLPNPARGSGRSGADVTAEFCKKLSYLF